MANKTKSLHHTKAHPKILLKNLDSYILFTVNQNSALTFLRVETAVRALDFKSCSDRLLELFLSSPEFNSSAGLENSQLQDWILNHVMLNLIYFFVKINAWLHYH